MHLYNITLNSFCGFQNVQLDFIIDIHADISHEGVFVRGNSYDDVYRWVVSTYKQSLQIAKSNVTYVFILLEE